MFGTGVEAAGWPDSEQAGCICAVPILPQYFTRPVLPRPSPEPELGQRSDVQLNSRYCAQPTATRVLATTASIRVLVCQSAVMLSQY